ncbi:class I SAM-dependent methyltransferase [uncultured Oscillibacter sp.]|uniref:class I SAM-dependent methyltransferase n=1 Tax=uncultured Oscillibacter sp. TaxID=876091 RepID=UPI0025FD6AB6|nr:class I SAM-dependent methyltransferase [uncultured Oscillibacter sp.]
MWIADRWEDYELLDCGCGQRLERWDRQVLVRPDPQAIWETPRRHPAWRKADGRYLRSSTGGGHWEKEALPESWKIRYGALTFQVKPMNFKHTGLFPEQAVNWDFMAEKIRGAGRPIRVLNLFAYTGGATLACAKAGASVCHVDAAKGMVTWARENARLSGLAEAPVRWIVDDCAKFVEREIRRGKTYDAIVMDPPSYGRGPGGEVWKLEEDLYPFVELCAGALSDEPLFVLINSYTTGLAPSVLGYLLELLVKKRHGGECTWDELGLPVRETGLALPCGATGRWSCERAGRRGRR